MMKVDWPGKSMNQESWLTRKVNWWGKVDLWGKLIDQGSQWIKKVDWQGKSIDEANNVDSTSTSEQLFLQKKPWCLTKLSDTNA